MEFPAAPEITAALKEAADFGIYGYTVADSSYKGRCVRLDGPPPRLGGGADLDIPDLRRGPGHEPCPSRPHSAR